MGDPKVELAKLIARRRMAGGEFSYVLRAGGEPLAGKKAVYAKLKEAHPEAFASLKAACGSAGETEEAFDGRMVRLVPQLPYEEDPKGEAMEVEEQRVPMKELTADLVDKVVRLDGVSKKEKTDEVVSHFCREFEGVVTVEAAKTFPPKSYSFDVTFKEAKFAAAFLALEEVKYQEVAVRRCLLAEVIREKVLRRQVGAAFAHNQRVLGCIPLAEGAEERSVLVHGVGRPSEEELQEWWVGGKAGVQGVASAKLVLQGKPDQPGAKVLGVLVVFETKEMVDKFVEQKVVTLEGGERMVKYYHLGEVVRANEVRLRKANYVVDDGPTTQHLSNRRLIILRLKEDYSPEVEAQLKALYPEAKDVRHCTVDKLTIVTFPTAEAAAAAASRPTDLAKPVMVMLVSEYLEKRGVVLEEEADRVEKVKTKYENIKNSCVTEEATKIIITDPNPPKTKAKKEEVKKEAVAKKEPAAAAARAEAPSLPSQPILRKRAQRGANVFDKFVGVRGFAQHIKNMGRASDMDVCNYFIHNHKDVEDVKFLNWTEIVFAKFKTVEAAERFISLAYVMFYGVELALHDVPDFLRKKKDDKQKEDAARVMLNAKFDKGMLEGSGPTLGAKAVTNGATNGAAPAAARNPEVELAAFSSKAAGEGIRDIFIENLHLDQEVVGQPRWSGSGEEFKARLVIKLEEAAIGYLVKKWNDLEISVEGEQVVKAEVAGGQGSPAKRARKKPNKAAGGKRPKISLEDY